MEERQTLDDGSFFKIEFHFILNAIHIIAIFLLHKVPSSHTKNYNA